MQHHCHAPSPTGHPAVPLPQLCHLESPAAIPCPCTWDGWPPLHHRKGNEAAGLSLPGHATWVGLVRKRQSSENPQIWPLNPPAAPKARLPSATFGSNNQRYLHRWLYLASSIGRPKSMGWRERAHSSMARQQGFNFPGWGRKETSHM